jgi:hypothetical protein
MSDNPRDRDPREYPWGHYAHDDIPGIGATGRFEWHASKEVSAHHLQWLIEQYIESEGWGAEKKAAARTALAGVKDGSVQIDEAMQRLNKQFENLIQVAWWGQYEEIRSGDSDFARDIRENICVSRAEGDIQFDDSPIDAGEEDEFIDAWQSYGY